MARIAKLKEDILINFDDHCLYFKGKKIAEVKGRPLEVLEYLCSYPNCYKKGIDINNYLDEGCLSAEAVRGYVHRLRNEYHPILKEVITSSKAGYKYIGEKIVELDFLEVQKEKPRDTESAEIEGPHIYLTEVKPITENYVRHPAQVMKQIDDCLDELGMCFVYGISGTGKSELIRQYAEEHGRGIPVLEIYFPEETDHYTMDQIVSSLDYVNLKEAGSLDEKKEVFRHFLEKEVLLLVHNFNAPDVTFLQKECKREHVKLLVSTQCTKEELERKKIPEACLIEQKPEEELCVRILKQVYKNYRKELPGQEEELHTLSQLLFHVPIFVNTVAMQLVELEAGEFQWLLEELRHAHVEDVFVDTPEILYQKDGTEKIEGTPFEVVYHIIQKILPHVSEMEKQCLQVITKFPNEWVPLLELARILGDLPNHMRYKKANTALKKLIGKHLLQEKQIEGRSYVSIHALLAAVVCFHKEGECYLDEADKAFWTHLERNAFVDRVSQKNGLEAYSKDEDYFEGNKIAAAIKYWYEKNILRADTEKIKWVDQCMENLGWDVTMQLFSSFSKKEKPFINESEMIECSSGSSAFFYESILITCEAGAVLLQQVEDGAEEKAKDKTAGSKDTGLRKYKVLINAADQNLHRYYGLEQQVKSLEEESSIESRVFWKNMRALRCSAKVLGVKNPEQTVVFPADFEGIPITNITYIDQFSEPSGKEYRICLPETCRCFRGESHWVNEVVLNEGLEVLDFVSEQIHAWKITASVREISERSITPSVTWMEVDEKNEEYEKNDGVVVTKDLKTILFLPPEKRILSTVLPESVTRVNLSCLGYKKSYFSVYEMSFSQVDWLLARRNELSTFEKNLLVMGNSKTIEEIFDMAEAVLAFYRDYVKNEKVSDCFPFFGSYNNVHVFNMDTGEGEVCPVETVEFWIKRYLHRAEGIEDTLLDKLDILQHSCENLNFEKRWRMSVEKSTNKG